MFHPVCHLATPCLALHSSSHHNKPCPPPLANASHTHANAVRTRFAPDAQLTTPIYKIKNADNIRDVLNLHHALATDTVGKIDWDEK